jgi:hypothetical protein
MLVFSLKENILGSVWSLEFITIISQHTGKGQVFVNEDTFYFLTIGMLISKYTDGLRFLKG